MKTKLVPIDSELFLMVESLTGCEPIVKEKKNEYNMYVDFGTEDTKKIKAINYAIIGRINPRLIRSIFTKKNYCIYSIRYADNCEEMPTENRTDLYEPNIEVATKFIPYPKQVYAVKVIRTNERTLYDFTGGGVMKILRTINGVMVYSFVTPNGTLVDARENDYIVTTDGNKFDVIPEKQFINDWRLNPIDMLNDYFGTNISLRMRKLAEEYEELKEVANKIDLSNLEPGKHTPELEDFMDELSDLNAVIFHIAGILGLTQGMLLDMAIDKITKREINPDYKRKHPHNERLYCEDCKYFERTKGTVK